MGSLTRPFVGISEAGSLSSGLVSGLVGSKWPAGPLPSNPSAGEASKVAEALVGGSEIGPSCPMGKGWAAVSGPPISYRDRPGPSQPQPFESGLLLKARPPAHFGSCKGCNLELEFIMFREKEVWRKQHPDSYRTMIDRALEEEAARYGLVVNSEGLRAPRSSSSNFFYFGRTPKGEYYDYSGALREGIQEGIGLCRPDADEHAEKGNGC